MVKDGEATRRRVLSFISDFMEKNNWAPSYREICDGGGIRSTSTISMHMHKLEFDGCIVLGRGARQVVITDKGRGLIGESEGSDGDI